MKKFFVTIMPLLLVSFVSVTTITSCSKSDLKTTASADLATSLAQSSQFSEFVASANCIMNSINYKEINRSDLKKAAGLYAAQGTFTTEEFTQVLNLLHIDAKEYIRVKPIMSDAIKSFQSKYNLSNEDNAAVWRYVIEKNSALFKVNNENIAGINEFIACIQDAGTTFAATTAICLALREIPIIGEKLFEDCEKTAVTNLIDDLLGCAGL